MTARRYSTAEAFKAALEARIKSSAPKAIILSRYRQKRIYDRFLARIFGHFGSRAVLKGGIVMELRVEQARYTKDVDLCLFGPSHELLVELRRAGQIDLGDYLTFDVDPDPRHPAIAGEGIIYEGQRFRVQAMLAGKVYGGMFGLDAVFGDAMTHPPEFLEGDDFFSFAGLPRTQVRVYAREVHLAEKTHALTMPRARENSRIKDLPDIALLATTGPFSGAAIREALSVTFGRRGTHLPPNEIPTPPPRWFADYPSMAQENNLPWPTMDELLPAVRAFLDPVLRGDEGTWDPQTWAWRAPS